MTEKGWIEIKSYNPLEGVRVTLQPNRLVPWLPNLEEAIERQPLTIPPTATLAEAIALFSQSYHECSLPEKLELSDPPNTEIRTSCLLVIQERQLLGILTARDVVRLTAQSLNFANTTVADVMTHPLITLTQQTMPDIFAVLFLFRRYRIRHLPIVDDLGHLVGVISHESVRHILRPANLLRLRRVSDVMTPQVISAPLTASVLYLAQLMATHKVSCVVITQPDGNETAQPVGIVTERDMVQFQALQVDLGKTQAQMVMSTPLFLLSPEDTLWTAHQEMQQRRVGRLVVSWNWGRGLGIVTQTSLLRVFDPMEMYGVIEHLQQTIQQLEVDRLASHRSALSTISHSPLDRDRLLAWLDITRTDVEQMLADFQPTIEQSQLRLQIVLEQLEHLDRALRGIDSRLQDSR